MMVKVYCHQFRGTHSCDITMIQATKGQALANEEQQRTKTQRAMAP